MIDPRKCGTLAEAYLQSMIQQYSVQAEAAVPAANLVVPIIQRWGGKQVLSITFSGSLAKGTAISLSTDADLFISVSSATATTLENMYSTLNNALTNNGYMTRQQNVSIGITVDGKKFDLIPAKRQSQYGNEHSLYKSKQGSWTKTNIQNHINMVSSSGRTEEVMLAKIWRERHGLEFPSFYLELAVLDALNGRRYGQLTENFAAVLQHFKDSVPSRKYVDPANSTNVISDELGVIDKMLISSQASMSLQGTWGEAVW